MAEAENDKQRAETFDALGHPLRLRILKVLSEGSLGFADLKRSLNIESSGHIQFHLDKLSGLIKTEGGKYCISDKGKDALLTMQPIEKYNEDSRLREQAGLLIRALRSDQQSVQDIAISQLSLLGPKVVPYVKSALIDALNELKGLEEGNLQSSYGYQKPTKASERALTDLVIVLGIIGVPSAVSEISQTLPRTEAFEALAKIGNKQALDAVISLIPVWDARTVPHGGYHESNEDEVRENHIDNFYRKIFNSFDEEGRIALETALISEDFIGKNVIARILAVVGDDKSIPALMTTLEKGEFSTKTEAAKALKRLRATEGIPKIINELFQTEDLILSAMENREYPITYDDAQQTCNALVNTVLSLGSIDDWITVAYHRPRIDDYAEPFDRAIINSKEQSVPALTKLLEAPDPSVQSAAAEMILKIKRGDNENTSPNYRFRSRNI